VSSFEETVAWEGEILISNETQHFQQSSVTSQNTGILDYTVVKTE
jgi:hypothetical protein